MPVSSSNTSGSEHTLDNFSKIESLTSKAKGKYSTAIGEGSSAASDYSMSIGNHSVSIFDYSYAHGDSVMATGKFSNAIGTATAAMNDYAYAGGNNSSALGKYSFSYGLYSDSKGMHSFGFGKKISTGNFSFSFGNEIKNIGSYSMLFGDNLRSKAKHVLIFGKDSSSSGDNTISLGNNNNLNSENSIVIGNNLSTNLPNSIVIGSGLEGAKLSNNQANSLIVGFNSNIPTLIVTSASGAGSTGAVGIGTQEIDPLSKLHVKGKLVIDDGTQGEGKILVSDDKGKTRWVDPKDVGLIIIDKTTLEKENQKKKISKILDIDESGNVYIGKNTDDSSLESQSSDLEQYEDSHDTQNLGIGVNNPQQKLHLSGAMRLEPMHHAPENAAAGDLYFNASGAFCGYIKDENGVGYWQLIAGHGFCV